MVKAGSLAEICEITVQAGFKGIDFMGAELGQKLAEAKAAIANTGLIPSSVYGQLGAPGTSFVDLTAADRASAIDAFKERIEATAELGSSKLIFVPRMKPPHIRMEAADWVLITMLDEIAEWMKDIPVTLVLEPLNRKETPYIFDPLHGQRIIDLLGSPKVRTMVDTYHMEMEGQDMIERIRKIGGDMGLVHLSDTSRALPGKGQIDFPAVLKALKEIGYQGPMGFECKPATGEQLKESVDYLNGIMNSL
jgi:sugar phosphate isomerase/epimerase